MALFDASKALDRINHNKLFAKLTKRGGVHHSVLLMSCSVGTVNLFLVYVEMVFLAWSSE